MGTALQRGAVAVAPGDPLAGGAEVGGAEVGGAEGQRAAGAAPLHGPVSGWRRRAGDATGRGVRQVGNGARGRGGSASRFDGQPTPPPADISGGDRPCPATRPLGREVWVHGPGLKGPGPRGGPAPAHRAQREQGKRQPRRPRSRAARVGRPSTRAPVVSPTPAGAPPAAGVVRGVGPSPAPSGRSAARCPAWVCLPFGVWRARPRNRRPPPASG